MYRQVGGALPIGEYEGPTADRRRKQEYLHELQRQAEEDRARKNQERQSIDEPTGLALGAPQRPAQDPRARAGYFPDIRRRSAEDYHEHARRQQRVGAGMASFDAERRPDGPEKPLSGAEHGDILRTIRRWEDIFTHQMSSSMQAITDLTQRVVELEGDLAHQSREKQHLRERVEHSEMQQQDLQQAKKDLQHAVQQRDQISSGEREKWQQDIQKLHGALSAQKGKVEEAAMAADRRADGLELRLAEEAQRSRGLLERVEAAERAASAAKAHVNSGSQHQQQWSSRHEAVLGELQNYVQGLDAKVAAAEHQAEPTATKVVLAALSVSEGAQQERMAAIEQELVQTRRALASVQNEARQQVEAAGSVSESGMHALQAQVSDMEKQQQAKVAGLEQGLAEEREARERAWERLQGQLNHVSGSITDAIRSADADHAGLLAALHDKMMEQLTQQDRFGSALQEALEGKREFLEQVVRAEIQSRQASVEDLKGETEKRLKAAEEAAAAAREEMQAQVKLVGAKAKANERGLRQALARAEAAEANAERARDEAAQEVERMKQQQTEGEGAWREAQRVQREELEGQIRAVKAEVEEGGGRRGRSAEAQRQEATDRGQDERIKEVQAQVLALQSKLESVAGEQQSAMQTVHGTLPNLKMKLGMLSEEIETRAAEHRREVEASRAEAEKRVERSAAAVEELKKELSEAIAGVRARSEELRKEGEGRAAEKGREVERMREEMEERAREADGRVQARWREAAEKSEGSELRRELAGMREAVHGAKQRMESFVAESREWKVQVEASQRGVQEEVLRAQELVNEELRRLFESTSDLGRSTETKFARLDVKVTEDVRKIVAALATHKETLEQLQGSTSERLAELQREEERQLRRLWEALKEVKGKLNASVEELRAAALEEQHQRQEQHLLIQGQVDQLVQRAEEGKAEAERGRAEEGERLAKEIAQLREEMQDAEAVRGQEQHELDYALQAVKHAHEVDGNKLREETKALVAAERAERERVEQEQAAAVRELEAVQRELEAVRALQSAQKESAVGGMREVSEEVERVRRAVAQEEAERQAAVGEVYRRIQVQREMDALLNQVQEQLLRSEVEDSKKQLQSFSSSSQATQQQQMQEIGEALSTLREQEAELKAAQRKHEEELEENKKRSLAVETALGASVTALTATVAQNASSMEDTMAQNQADLQSRVEEVEQQSRERDDAIEARLETMQGEQDTRMASLEEGVGGVRKQVEGLEDATVKGEEASKTKAEEASKREGELSERVEALEKQTKERDDALEAKIADMEVKGEEASKATAEEASKKEGELAERLEALETQTKARDDELEAKIAGVEKESGDGRSEVEAKVKAIEEKASKLEQGGEQSAAEVAAKVEELDERCKKVEAEHVSKDDMDKQLNKLDDRVKGVEASYVTQEKMKEHVQESVGACEQRVAAAEEQTQALEKRVEAVEGMGKAVEGMKERVGKLESLGKELDELRVAKQDEVDARKNDLTRVEACETEIKELRRNLKQVESQGISDEAVAALPVVAGLKEKVGTCEGRVDGIEKARGEEKLELESKFKELKLEDEKKAEKADLEFKVTGLKGEMDTMSSQRSQDAKRLEAVEKGEKETKKRMDKLEDGKGGADPELDSRVKKVEETVQSMEPLLEQQKAMVAMNSKAVKDLEPLKDMEVDVNNKIEQFKTQQVEPLNFRLDSLKIPELKKEVNDNSKKVEKLDKSMDKMGKQVAEALKMIEDLVKDD